MQVKVSVITVTYNNQHSIDAFLKSVAKISGDIEVVVVDNDSSDETVARVKSYKGVRLIRNKKNMGFSKACNIGASFAFGEYLFFINPDSEVLQKAFMEVCNFTSLHPQAGLVVPALVQDSGHVQSSVTHLPTLWGALREYYLGEKNSFSAYAPGGEKEVEVDAVYGAAMCIRADVFGQVGGFDERYFLYFEDLQICKDIRRLGYKIYCLPYVRFRHEVGGSVSEKKEQLSLESSYVYHGKFKAKLLYWVVRVRNFYVNKVFRGSAISGVLALLLLVAFLVRAFPVNYPFLTVEEARVSFRGYQLANFGTDELGRDYPLVFNSLSDYSLAFVNYSSAVGVKFFGKEVGTRMSYTLLGVVLVWLAYVFAATVSQNRLIGLSSALVFALAPGFIFISRVPNSAAVLAALVLGLVNLCLRKRFVSWLVVLVCAIGLATAVDFWIVVLPLLLWNFLSRLILGKPWDQKKAMVVSFIVVSVLALVSILLFANLANGLRSLKENNFNLFFDPALKNAIEHLRGQGLLEGWLSYLQPMLWNKSVYPLVGLFNMLDSISLYRMFGSVDSKFLLGFPFFGVFAKSAIIPVALGFYFLAKKNFRLLVVIVVNMFIVALPSFFVSSGLSSASSYVGAVFVVILAGFGFYFSPRILKILVLFLMFLEVVYLYVSLGNFYKLFDTRPLWSIKVVEKVDTFASKVLISDDLVDDFVPLYRFYSKQSQEIIRMLDYPYKYRETKIDKFDLVLSEQGLDKCLGQGGHPAILSSRDRQKLGSIILSVGEILDESGRVRAFIYDRDICVK